MPSLHCIVASTSGHTDYVVEIVRRWLDAHAPEVSVTYRRAEEATPEDFGRGDALLLGSGTWNTGGIEGQLNPHMDSLLRGRAKDVDLRGRKAAIVALGDQRYFYTARAGEHLRSFVQTHGGSLLCDPLVVVNEPYGQEARVEKWAGKLLKALQGTSLTASRSRG